MKIHIKLFIIIALGFFSLTAQAQYDQTLYNLREYTPFGHSLNPSAFPDAGSYLLLPLHFQTYVSTGFSLNDLYRKQSEGKLYGSLEYLLGNINRGIYSASGYQMPVLGVGSRINHKHFFSLDMSIKSRIAFNVPRGMLKFLSQGNVDENSNIINHEFESLHLNGTVYGEISAGFGTKINEKLQVGLRLKYLWGIANIYGDIDSRLVTNDDYSINLKTNEETTVYTSGLLALLDDDESEYSDAGEYALAGKNNGFAIDLGATYQLDENIKLSASLIDLGYISWKDDLKSNRLPEGVEFLGSDLDRLLEVRKKYSDGYFDFVSDSLKNKYDVVEGKDKYTTWLHGKLYINGSYDYNRFLTFGSTLAGTAVSGEIHTAISLYTTLHLGRCFHLNTNYSYQNGSFANWGAGFVFTPGPFQLYVATDNILPSMKPEIARAVDLRFGLNLIFGKRKYYRKKAKMSSTLLEN